MIVGSIFFVVLVVISCFVVCDHAYAYTVAVVLEYFDFIWLGDDFVVAGAVAGAVADGSCCGGGGGDAATTDDNIIFVMLSIIYHTILCFWFWFMFCLIFNFS